MTCWSWREAFRLLAVLRGGDREHAPGLENPEPVLLKVNGFVCECEEGMVLQMEKGVVQKMMFLGCSMTC